ncbi:MAG: O-antigen ligase family protein [Candidatus Magasanikbacteria bacterium]|nr:O-antigen ligase family protein [Candidatus Magasanikbacteria bacterium]
MNLTKTRQIILYFLYSFLFLLPWQTRLIYSESSFFSGRLLEYGRSSLYATELILWVVILGVGLPIIFSRRSWAQVLEKINLSKNFSRLIILISIFLLLAFYLFLSPFPDISYNTIFRVLEGLCLIVIVHELTLTQSENRRALYAFWLGGVGQGLLAIWQFFSQSVMASKWLGLAAHSAANLGDFVIETGAVGISSAAVGGVERWLRAYGAFPSPNILGAFLATAFLVGVILTLHVKTVRERLGLAVGQIFISAGLFFSFSRSAWVGLIAGLVYLGIIIWRRQNSPEVVKYQKIAWRWNLFILGATALLLATIYSPLITTRLSGSGPLEARSINDRFSQVSTWTALISATPRNFLLGAGPGLYTYALRQYNPNFSSWAYDQVHNTYLLIFAELGLLGFVLLFFLSFSIINLIKKQNPLWLAVIAAMLAAALFDHFWWSLYAGQMLWWGVLALGLGRSSAE